MNPDHENVCEHHARPVLGPSLGRQWIYTPNCPDSKVIEWRGTSVDFAGKQVISNVNAWIYQHEFTCICGTNGAGKTQLIRLSLGLMEPRAGQVLLLGGRPRKTRCRVGYVPQQKNFNRNFPATVLDVLVAAFRGSWPIWTTKGDRDLAAEFLEKIGGLHLLDKDMGVLSGGELQRVFMARALITKPEVLILDEPMAAVDTKGRAQMMELLRNIKKTRNLTVVLITHSDSVVTELAERVMFLERGQLVGWGTPSEVLGIDELRQVAFFGHDHEGVIEGVNDTGEG